jgi:hypothetical protein
MIPALLIAAAGAAGAQPPGAVGARGAACTGGTSEAIVVCAPPHDRYRIDPAVLEADRRRDAPPPQPPEHMAATPGSNACVGPDACKGGVVPVVGMALAAAKAVALAAEGEDWREAIRTHDDEYRLYQQAQQRRANERRPRIGISVAK